MIGLLGLITGGLALFLTLSKKAEAAPPESYIPTAEEIDTSQSLEQLDAYYELINELYIAGQIGQVTYSNLYSAYETRFYELVEEH